MNFQITDQTSSERKGLFKGIVFTAKGNSRSGYFPTDSIEIDRLETGKKWNFILF